MHQRLFPFLAAIALVVGVGPAAQAHHSEAELRVARLLPGPASTAVEPGADAALSTPRYRWLIPRAETDRADSKTGSLLHVSYLLPAGSPDESLDTFGVIEDSMLSQNSWFRAQSGGLQWRLDTFSFPWDDPETEVNDPVTVEAVDVTFIRSSKSAPSLNTATEVSAELQLHGLSDPNKRYLTYVASDGDGACGDSFYWVNVPPTEMREGRYAHVYLDGPEGCRSREFASSPTDPSFAEEIAQHEILHNESVVLTTAPHQCWAFLGHVCTGPLVLTSFDPESADLMFPFAGLPLSEKILDRGHDDYFKHPLPSHDLEDSTFLEPAA